MSRARNKCDVMRVGKSEAQTWGVGVSCYRKLWDPFAQPPRGKKLSGVGKGGCY